MHFPETGVIEESLQVTQCVAEPEHVAHSAEQAVQVDPDRYVPSLHWVHAVLVQATQFENFDAQVGHCVMAP